MRTTLIALAIALLGGSVAANPDKVVVPDLTGMTRAQAKAALAKAGLGDLNETDGGAEAHSGGEVAFEDCMNGTHDGTICLQYPAAGEREGRGDDISVKVGQAAAEPVHAMPDLAGMPLDKAQAAFAKAGFTSPLFDNSSQKCAKGIVCSQSWPAGKKVRASTTVMVWVGR